MTTKIIDELGSDKVNYREFPDPAFTHEGFLMGFSDPNVLKILREELTSELYEVDSAFALTTASAVIAAITAVII